MALVFGKTLSGNLLRNSIFINFSVCDFWDFQLNACQYLSLKADLQNRSVVQVLISLITKFKKSAVNL